MGRSSGSSSTARQALGQGQAGVRGLTNFISTDLTTRAPSIVYNAKPPRSLNNQIHFVRSTSLTNIATSTSTITEVNYQWTVANNLVNSTNYLAVFDQYYLHSVVCTITNLEAPGGTGTIPFVITAIDYDNTAALGASSILEGFVTANTTLLTSGCSVVRYIEPSVGITLNGGGGVGRTWVDSANNSTPFFGFRSITSTTSLTTTLDLFFQMIWAFRNPI